MKKILLFSLSALLFITANAQTGVSINNTGNSANASAMLDVSSTTTGFLFPRMTEAQRDAIVLPATGLMIFQTDGAAPGVYLNGGTPAAPNWLNASGANSINDLSDARIVGNSVFMGTLAGNSFATGSFNAAIGIGALAGTDGANGNTALGYSAGSTLTTGSGNILIGANTFASSGTANSELNIGRTIFATGLNGTIARVGIGYDNNAPNSTLDVSGSFTLPVRLEASNYTLTENDYTVVGVNNIITLPSPDTIIGRIYVIKAGVTGAVSLAPDGSDVIDGNNATINIPAGKYIQVQALVVGNWVIIGQN